jgi:putative ABC transport system substrate-binding protein
MLLSRHTRRLEFIAELGGATTSALWPPAARAHQAERVRRVGALLGEDAAPARKLLRDDLEKLDWIEGRNLRLDFRFGGDANQTRIFVADLVRLAPDVIVAAYGVAIRALQRRTKTIPVIFAWAGDAFAGGIKSARAEGNVTGFANAFSLLGGKWMELLKEVTPNVTRVLYLYPVGLDSGGSYLHSVETAARSLAVRVIAIPVSDAAGIKAAIEAFAEPNGGLLLSPGVSVIGPLVELTRLAAQFRLPAIYASQSNEGLMSYGADFAEIFLGAATYVNRLLRGAKVSDLPVQYPTKFRLVINLKTAKALGLEVPPSILLRADEVIE